jgi:hypothetical protein
MRGWFNWLLLIAFLTAATAVSGSAFAGLLASKADVALAALWAIGIAGVLVRSFVSVISENDPQWNTAGHRRYLIAAFTISCICGVLTFFCGHFQEFIGAGAIGIALSALLTAIIDND